MYKVNHNHTATQKRILRIRTKVRGTAERPRLTVNRTNRAIYLQVIDDQAGKTLAAVNSIKDKSTTKVDEAIAAARTLAEQLKEKKIAKLVFDRGGYRYHGRVKAVADAMREQGLEV